LLFQPLQGEQRLGTGKMRTVSQTGGANFSSLKNKGPIDASRNAPIGPKLLVSVV